MTRKIGLWTVVSIVMGNMIGSGVFMLPATLAHYGGMSLLAWLVTGLGTLCLALICARLSRSLPVTGGIYVYSRHAFGDYPGFQVFWNYWINAVTGNIGYVVALAGALSIFFPEIAHNKMLSFSVCAGVMWLFIFINMWGVKEVGIVQVILNILKLVPLVLVGLVGCAYFNPDYLMPFNASGEPPLTALSGASMIVLWAFIGFESGSVPADHIENPGKTVARATIIGTLLTLLVYMVCITSVMGLIPPETLKTSTAPFADAARILFGDIGFYLIGAGAIASCLGVLNGWTLLCGQLPYAAARDGIFPKIFSKLSKRDTPVWGLFISGIIQTILLAMTLCDNLVDQFNIIVKIAVMAMLVAYVFLAGSEVMLDLKGEIQVKDKAMSYTLAFLGGLYVLWAMFGAGQEVMYYGSLLFFGSTILYIWAKIQHRNIGRVK